MGQRVQDSRVAFLCLVHKKGVGEIPKYPMTRYPRKHEASKPEAEKFQDPNSKQEFPGVGFVRGNGLVFFILRKITRITG